MKNENLKRLWKGFWQVADPKVWIASTIPMLMGASLGYKIGGGFSFPWLILAIISIYFIEIGKNASNEYVDYKTGVDINVDKRNVTPFSGGKKTIVQGKLTLHEVKSIAIGTFLIACGIGLLIVLFKEPGVIWIGLLGVFISVFYSVPPFSFAYLGFGELAVGLTYGPLITLGMYYLMAGHFDWKVLLAGLPTGFLITNVLWINQYPDFESDTLGNKRNWVVRLGKKKGLKIYSLLFVLAYATLIPISVFYNNIYWLLGLLSIPLAIRAVNIANRQYNDIQKLIKANVYTLIIYQVTGILLIFAIFLSR